MPSLGWVLSSRTSLGEPKDHPTVRTSGEGDRSSEVILPGGHAPATPGDTAKDTGDARVSSWAAPGTGIDTGVPAGPDAQRRGRDWQVASSSTTSCAVAASAMSSISDTEVETS
jgi:hypothetical protein